MKYIILLFFFVFHSSCEKCLKTLIRDDYPGGAEFTNGIDTFHYSSFIKLSSPFDDIPQVYIDSMNKLTSLGYYSKNWYGTRFNFINCDECEAYARKNRNTRCVSYGQY